MISLSVRAGDLGGTEWTDVSFAGEDEDTLALLFTSKLVALGWEVEVVEDNEGIIQLENSDE